MKHSGSKALVVDTLLWRLNSADVYAQAYADDVTILLSGREEYPGCPSIHTCLV